MKYRIGNRVINADHIVEVRYIPETPEDSDPDNRPSICTIETVNDGPTGFEHITRLRGDKADQFWAEYSADAVQTTPSQPEQQAHEYVTDISTENTGGDVMVDVITLKSGKAITISDEAIVMWNSINEWQGNSDPVNEIWLV